MQSKEATITVVIPLNLGDRAFQQQASALDEAATRPDLVSILPLLPPGARTGNSSNKPCLRVQMCPPVKRTGTPTADNLAICRAAVGSILMPLPDTHLINNPGWDQCLRDTAALLLPTGGLGVLASQRSQSSRLSYPAVVALCQPMIDVAGYLWPTGVTFEQLPAWWAEVGLMASLLVEVPWEAQQIAPLASHWVMNSPGERAGFNATRARREGLAQAIIELAFADEPGIARSLMHAMYIRRSHAAALAKRAELRQPLSADTTAGAAC